MARGLLGLIAFLAVMAVIIFALKLIFDFFVKRMTQRNTAKYAPELLSQHDLDPAIVRLIVEDRRRLEEAARIMRNALADPFHALPTHQADPMQQWLASNRKEIV